MTEIVQPAEPTVLAALNRLLKNPEGAAAEAGEDRIGYFFAAGALACFALYGIAAGFFQGDQQIAIAALKTPVIIFGTAVLCLPSLYVFTSLAGSELSFSRTAGLLAGFCGVLGLLMLGMIPIAWLFSVSSRSILFVFWMHLLMWLAALAFARNFLGHAFRSSTQRHVIRLWLFLFVLVSFQMTTHLRPILWRDSGERMFSAEKMSFLDHFRAMNRAVFAPETTPKAPPR